MAAPRLSLADELAELRDEIARLQRREIALARIGRDLPVVPVFRPGWPIRRAATGAAVTGAAAQPARQAHHA